MTKYIGFFLLISGLPTTLTRKKQHKYDQYQFIDELHLESFFFYCNGWF